MRKVLLPALPLFVVALIVSAYSFWSSREVRTEVREVALQQALSLTETLDFGLRSVLLGSRLFQELVRDRVLEYAALVKDLMDKGFTPDSATLKGTRVAGIYFYLKDGDLLWKVGRDPAGRPPFPFPESDTLFYSVGTVYGVAFPVGEGVLAVEVDEGDLARKMEQLRFERLLDYLSSSGDLVYLALLDNRGRVISWSSRYGDFLPLGAPGTPVGDKGRARVIETRVGRILEIRSHPASGMQLVAGYSLFRSDRFAGEASQNLYLAALVLGVLGLALVAWAVRTGRFAERRERDLLIQRAEAERFRELSALAAAVAHEIRNPLNTIGMALQRIRAREVPPHMARYIHRLEEAVRRMNQIVEAFGTLARPFHPHKQRFSPYALAYEVAQELAPDRVQVEGDPEVQGEGDPRLIRQALLNLVQNALDASEGPVWLRVLRRNGRVEIRVRDQGPGMDAEEVQAALRPFHTTKGLGLGLGLPLARRIAEAHGGRLEIHSEKGKGTEVCLIL